MANENAKKDKDLVVQSNQFVRTTGSDCTALSAKIIYLLISKIRNDSPLDESGAICVDVEGSEIWKTIGNDKNRTTEYLSDLLRTVSKALYFSTENRAAEMYPWFSRVSFDRADPKGTVHFKFNPYLNEYLLDQKRNFTKYNLKYIMALRSPHSVRLYNLLISYAYMPEVEIRADDLRFILNLTKSTCGKNRCSELWRMRQRVLDPALEEINEKTDLRVKMEVAGDTKNRTIRFRLRRLDLSGEFAEITALEGVDD